MKRILWGTTLVVLCACSEDVAEPAQAAPSAPPTTTQTPPKKPVKRTVETRAPFGGPAGNLLVDGDFELSISFEGSGEQLAWIAFTQSGGEAYLRGETGGLCKSGISCGVLEPGVWLYGRGTAAKDAGMEASIWIKPPARRGCDVATVEIIHCNFGGSAVELEPVAEQPGTDGWCQLIASVEPQEQSVCMLITSNLADGESAVVDRATLLAADRTSAMRRMTPVPGARRARIAHLSDVLRKRTPF